MSTFNGVVQEFPDIRIDYFRLGENAAQVKACFLSHAHSDHLVGLESLRSPFVYCSAATKELVLRLERYQDRIRLDKGILESRCIKYKGRRFNGILRTIPLNVPTEVELTSARKLRVTLLPANHCPGSVMFLIERDDTAILYTGDIRAEAWWVNSIARSPLMIPYSKGLRTLDRIYLDTTFAIRRNIFKKCPTKADGISELIAKVARYPTDTIFHVNSWTLGYEEVFVALAAALRCQVHVDDYKMRLYAGLAQVLDSEEGSALYGFTLGNSEHRGCLTKDVNTRLHTCELGTDCEMLKRNKAIYVTPVVTRTDDGKEVLEQGAAAGTGDLDLAHEIDMSIPEVVTGLLQLGSQFLDERSLSKLASLIADITTSGRKILSVPSVDLPAQLDSLTPKQVLELILEAGEKRQDAAKARKILDEQEKLPKNAANLELPKKLTFPYSRHSSYDELCLFVSTFKPKDVYPCVVDETNWTPETSIQALFGEYCSESIFTHDAEMMPKYQHRITSPNEPQQQWSGQKKNSQASSRHEREVTPTTTDATVSEVPTPNQPSNAQVPQIRSPAVVTVETPNPSSSKDVSKNRQVQQEDVDQGEINLDFHVPYTPDSPVYEPKSDESSKPSVILIESDDEEQHDSDLEASSCTSASQSLLIESDAAFETDYSETSRPRKRKRRRRNTDYKMRIADRRKAYEAAANNEDGMQWSSLPVLVSLKGYQLEQDL